jgi:hypothetical protein
VRSGVESGSVQSQYRLLSVRSGVKSYLGKNCC